MAQGTLLLLPALFGGELAALRTLRLMGFSALKTRHHLHRLSRFDLQARSATRFKIDGLLDVLTNVPLLGAVEQLKCLEIRGKHAHEVLRLWPRLEQRTICPSLQSLVVVKNQTTFSIGSLRSLRPPGKPAVFHSLKYLK
ncbi:hypothetical protein BJ322DRAFT_444666 [Thelephora terrestris]|uniref:Uncharacterized protein n=1 Tax=Thelephora terrestris TaxID=56493 RepID=A0A9P6H4L5_9AGAM|nr:hypothetical protein BJ322DRAFT_444666 [Thelephora terrestris]